MLDQVPNTIKEDIVTCLKTYQCKVNEYCVNNEYNAYEVAMMHHTLTILANEKECKVLIDGELKAKAEMNDRKKLTLLFSNTRKMFDEVIRKSFMQ